MSTNANSAANATVRNEQSEAKGKIIEANFTRTKTSINALVTPQYHDEVAALERNILGVPMCVLHAKEAFQHDYLYHQWTENGKTCTFKLYRADRDVGLPIPEHARIMHTLIAFFAAKWNPDGELYFTVSQIMRALGYGANSGARDTVYQAISRYRKALAEWTDSWDGEESSWNQPFIIGADMYEDPKIAKLSENKKNAKASKDDADIAKPKLKRNAKNSKSEDRWNKIVFCKQIVKALADDETRRLIPRRILNKDLPVTSYLVYSYFYGFTDKNEVIRKISDLRNVFTWGGRADKFKKWLEKNLTIVLNAGYIESFKFENEYCAVKCVNIKDLKPLHIILDKPSDDESVVHLKVKPNGNLTGRKRRGAPSGKKMVAENVTTQALIEEYYARKAKGMVSEDDIALMEPILESARAKNNKLIMNAVDRKLRSMLAEGFPTTV